MINLPVVTLMANLSLKQQISNNFSNYKWFLHLLFWLSISGISIFQMFNTGMFKLTGTPADFIPYLSFIFKLITALLACYGFQFMVMPVYRRSKSLFWVLIFLLLIFIFLLQVVLIKLLYLGLSNQPTAVSASFISIISANLPRYMLVFFFFVSLYYFVDIHDQQKEIQKLARFKTQKIALESSFLKSQVNPHFLFNTLNNIYALSLKKSDQTQIVIERLESLLKYMLYECKADLVPLDNEFTFTNSYIALEKLRHKEEECKVTVQITGDTTNKKIAPLLLINFLENAFKHGTKSSFGKSWINMDVNISPRFIHFRLQNSKPFRPSGQAITEYKGGIGLKNVQRRLEILYPDRHRLNINNLKDRFEIDLLINF
ncbi:sensor histidine kinase [Pedobacter frigoris]|uniref:sensor histidine kinase n=1 Tax=Pedobacter frigoris TaxID=2571272 RepID=UPI0029318A4E|nr:histidine kinase [Pedobacter frigoris]